MSERYVLDDTRIGCAQDWNYDEILKGVVEGNVLGGVDAGRDDSALEGDLDEEEVGDCCQLTPLDGKGKGKSVPLNERLQRAEISVRMRIRVARRTL